MQFYLEEGVGDEEAVSLIDLEVPQTEQREASWSDGDTARILPAGFSFRLQKFLGDIKSNK